MAEGMVVDIFIAESAGMLPQSVRSARAHPGKGLEGDRYFNGTGTFLKPGQPLPKSQEATLIEVEAIEALKREHGITLAAAEARRNILTRGIRLNDLVNREFTVGAVRMKGIKLCHPCDHLEARTRAGVRAGLENRGGLRAQIIVGGAVEVGDAIAPVQAGWSAACAS